jgi:hypothetical protein
MEQNRYTPVMRKQEYGPSEGARLLRDLCVAAERLQREEFDTILNPAPVQLQFKFMCE